MKPEASRSGLVELRGERADFLSLERTLKLREVLEEEKIEVVEVDKVEEWRGEACRNFARVREEIKVWRREVRRL